MEEQGQTVYKLQFATFLEKYIYIHIFVDIYVCVLSPLQTWT